MVSLLRFGGFLALAATVLAVKPPKLDEAAQRNYDFHQDYIRSNYRHAFPPIELRNPTDQYSHYHGGNRNPAKELYEISQQKPYGPAQITYRGQTRAYVTTKVPWDYPLGRSWGLNYKEMDKDENVHRNELYAFWHYEKGGEPKLLRLDIWPAGSEVTQTFRWSMVL